MSPERRPVTIRMVRRSLEGIDPDLPLVFASDNQPAIGHSRIAASRDGDQVYVQLSPDLHGDEAVLPTAGGLLSEIAAFPDSCELVFGHHARLAAVFPAVVFELRDRAPHVSRT